MGNHFDGSAAGVALLGEGSDGEAGYRLTGGDFSGPRLLGGTGRGTQAKQASERGFHDWGAGLHLTLAFLAGYPGHFSMSTPHTDVARLTGVPTRTERDK